MTVFDLLRIILNEIFISLPMLLTPEYSNGTPACREIS